MTIGIRGIIRSYADDGIVTDSRNQATKDNIFSFGQLRASGQPRPRASAAWIGLPSARLLRVGLTPLAVP